MWLLSYRRRLGVAAFVQVAIGQQHPFGRVLERCILLEQKMVRQH